MGNRNFTLTALFFLVLIQTSAALARVVEFSWDSMEGAIKYEIQVSSDKEFKSILAESQLDKPSYSLTLNVGKYFYRVRVIDKKAKPGRWSKPEPLVVDPHSPELTAPDNNYEASYYDGGPEIQFTWTPIDGSTGYEILIYKSTGQKILESKVTSPSFKTTKVLEGEYMWKVRSVAKDSFISSYSDPRNFTVKKTPLTEPQLVSPANDSAVAGYRSVEFNWKQDPHAHYTDLTLEKLTAQEGEKPFQKKIANLTGTRYVAEYEEPGEFRWSVTSKEDKTTPGISSEIYHFEVRNDMISRGNYELEFSFSPVFDSYATSSARQTSGTQIIDQTSNASGAFIGFSAGYYFFESLGIFASTRTASLGIENLNSYEQETDANLRLRFGTKGFFQEFWFGYRMMDIVEAENNPAQKTTDFITTGPLLGTRAAATLFKNVRGQLTLFYYKPLSDMENIGNYNMDVYGGSLGLKWNFMYQFWLGYRISMERINANFTSPDKPASVDATWSQTRLEPVYLSVSYEH